jgi:hypothetical protein
MGEDNKDIWAFIPGETGLQMMRFFSFYKFTNPMDMFLRNDKPKLVLQSDYRY